MANDTFIRIFNLYAYYIVLYVSIIIMYIGHIG